MVNKVGPSEVVLNKVGLRQTGRPIQSSRSKKEFINTNIWHIELDRTPKGSTFAMYATETNLVKKFMAQFYNFHLEHANF